MSYERSFSILDSVDSTNNYAMGKVHAGMAKHGQAWFAKHQTAGKGQRGNTWLSRPDDNIILTVIIQPGTAFPIGSFYFNALVSMTCLQFLRQWDSHNFSIKWPNDLYWRDRKAGGMLIENVIQGNEWKWAVVGIGININQEEFPEGVKNPCSLSLINEQKFDSIELARELHTRIVDDLEKRPSAQEILQDYNHHLFQKNKEVKLKKGNSTFSTTIKEVDAFGRLHTEDTMERCFEFGEVSWV